MTKYVCPECGSDKEFVCVWQRTYEVVGRFNNAGNIEDNNPQSIDTMIDRYICLECDEEFDRPRKIDE